MKKSKKHLKKPQASKRTRRIPKRFQTPKPTPVDREQIQAESRGIQHATTGMTPFEMGQPMKGVEILKQTKK
jgi:hypothetical protein